MQHARGFIVGCANRVTLISWEAEHTEQQIGQAFIGKNHIISIVHTGYKVIGYMFTKQFYWYNFAGFCSNLKQFCWYKRRGLFSNLGARGLLSSPTGFYWVHIDWLAPGHPMGAGNPTISRETNPKSWPPASPSPGSPT